jgi:hypothetical protein
MSFDTKLSVSMTELVRVRLRERDVCVSCV